MVKPVNDLVVLKVAKKAHDALLLYAKRRIMMERTNGDWVDGTASKMGKGISYRYEVPVAQARFMMRLMEEASKWYHDNNKLMSSKGASSALGIASGMARRSVVKWERAHPQPVPDRAAPEPKLMPEVTL